MDREFNRTAVAPPIPPQRIQDADSGDSPPESRRLGFDEAAA